MSFPSQYAIRPEKPAAHRDGDLTRAKVLQAAAAQISAVGFHKMTIADVAAQAGVSQSGLLHHFPSKAALLAAVLDEREQTDSEFLFGDGTVPLGWDAFDSLVALAARNATRPEWVQLFVRIAAEASVPSHPAHDWVTRHYRSLRKWLTDAVEAGVTAGQIRRDAPAALIAETTIAVLDGVQQQWVVEPQAVAMVDNVREHVRVLKQAWSRPAA